GPTGVTGDMGPTGPTGVTGDMGPTGPISLGVYGHFTLSYAASVSPDSIIPLNFSNDLNTSQFSLNSSQITVQEAGVYLIDFRVSVAPANGGVFILRVNNISLPHVSFSVNVGGTATSVIVGSSTSIIRLNANDIVDIFRTGGSTDIQIGAAIDSISTTAAQLRLVKIAN
ncbi:collagen-like protein, partial [Bacillus tropicus]|uniref:collagen-like triple helix repeat-containing protein n=1 Tax=Bacillus tropicus TaxID=2026188 RepID=UPI003D228972